MTETVETATPEKAKRNFYVVDRVLDTTAMSITFQFANGENKTFAVADFPPPIQKQALLAGFASRIGQNVNKADSVADAVKAYESAVLQLMAGTWSNQPAANPATRLAVAYVQLATEQNKVMTLKAAKAQIEAKEAKAPGFAAGKMADAKFQSAYTRAQAKSETSLDDLD